jgi:hypothetical protein
MFDALGAIFEHLPRRDAGPRETRVRILEQADQERGDFFGCRAGACEPVPLLCELHGVERDQSADHEYNAERGRDAQRVTPQKLAAAIGPGIGMRHDRTMFEMTLDIVRELASRGVTTLGLLAHRSEDDDVQVAGELGARVARRQRHRLADRALQIERRETRYFVRLSLGEQLIEKNTEAVDVARGRDSRSAYLLRAALRGVSRRASATVRFAAA